MTIVCLLTDEDLGIGAPWEYTPRCDSCGRWCREYNDEWNGDHRCQRCARKENR